TRRDVDGDCPHRDLCQSRADARHAARAAGYAPLTRPRVGAQVDRGGVVPEHVGDLLRRERLSHDGKLFVVVGRPTPPAIPGPAIRSWSSATVKGSGMKPLFPPSGWAGSMMCRWVSKMG